MTESFPPEFNEAIAEIREAERQKRAAFATEQQQIRDRITARNKAEENLCEGRRPEFEHIFGLAKKVARAAVKAYIPVDASLSRRVLPFFTRLPVVSGWAITNIAPDLRQTFSRVGTILGDEGNLYQYDLGYRFRTKSEIGYHVLRNFTVMGTHEEYVPGDGSEVGGEFKDVNERGKETIRLVTPEILFDEFSSFKHGYRSNYLGEQQDSWPKPHPYEEYQNILARFAIVKGLAP
jgi:hypothetical protein